MPIHPDFVKIKANFITKYGDKKGNDFYYAWLNKNKFDDKVAMPKHISAENVMSSFTAAKWERAFMNDLPDSAFAWVESGGKKDDTGKTVPRSLRHLPYKDSSGKIDLPHLRNAIARLGQGMPFTMPASERASLQKRLQGILGKD
jgi:hypothetical protein